MSRLRPYSTNLTIQAEPPSLSSITRVLPSHLLVSQILAPVEAQVGRLAGTFPCLGQGVRPGFYQAVVNRSTPATLHADGVLGVVKQDGQVLLGDLY